ncbi:uncharacterized protein DS421_6g192380 [Arachis hypogaea]|nr:uncharacterized protein DS421_6g192380 [Arachis hypogaea]
MVRRVEHRRQRKAEEESPLSNMPPRSALSCVATAPCVTADLPRSHHRESKLRRDRQSREEEASPSRGVAPPLLSVPSPSPSPRGAATKPSPPSSPRRKRERAR